MSLDALVCLVFLMIQLGFYTTIVAFCQPGTPRRLVGIVAVVALLYPFGEMLQEFHAIPSFIRWHLSDLGYVPYQAMAVYALYLLPSFYKWIRTGGKKGVNNYFKDAKAVTIHVTLVALVLFAVTGYELFMDSTDMIDVLMYFVGAFAALVIYKKLGEYFKNTETPSISTLVPSIVR